MKLRQRIGEALAGVARDPFELTRIVRVAAATFYFRFLRRCAGPGCLFGMGNRIINAANVRIGRDCLFQDSIYIRAGANGRVEIGDRCAINSFVQIYGHGGIRLGEEAQLGPGTIVTTTDHAYDHRGAGLEAHFRPVSIGRKVWVGANATIIGGVTIGDGAIIGAGAVVIRDIPAHSVAVGVPARVVKNLRAAPAGTREPPAVGPTDRGPTERAASDRNNRTGSHHVAGLADIAGRNGVSDSGRAADRLDAALG